MVASLGVSVVKIRIDCIYTLIYSMQLM